MDLLFDILSWIFLIAGSVLTLIGGIGLIRLPDMYTRMHGASLIDTLGIGFILLGLVLQAGWTIVAIKLVLIFVFIFFTSPTATHALASAALDEGLKPLTGAGANKEQDPSKT